MSITHRIKAAYRRKTTRSGGFRIIDGKVYPYVVRDGKRIYGGRIK